MWRSIWGLGTDIYTHLVIVLGVHWQHYHALPISVHLIGMVSPRSELPCGAPSPAWKIPPWYYLSPSPSLSRARQAYNILKPIWIGRFQRGGGVLESRYSMHVPSSFSSTKVDLETMETSWEKVTQIKMFYILFLCKRMACPPPLVPELSPAMLPPYLMDVEGYLGTWYGYLYASSNCPRRTLAAHWTAGRWEIERLARSLASSYALGSHLYRVHKNAPV